MLSNMRIVSCDPYLTALVSHFGLEQALVGISHHCKLPEGNPGILRVTLAADAAGKKSQAVPSLQSLRKERSIDFDAVRNAAPEIIVAEVQGLAADEKILAHIRSEIHSQLGESAKFYGYDPCSLEALFDLYEDLARNLGVAAKGTALKSRVKAQIMDWCDSFYERMKGKKVTFLSSVEPLRLAGGWIADVIHLASAQSQGVQGGNQSQKTTWEDIVNFRPDAIVVAPQGKDLQSSLQLFKKLEKFPGWEDIPAVKRGEVSFADGSEHFYTPYPGLMDSAAILISALAGFESGYITERESFYRLRWLEMQRHRF